jgi:hypothetical protein
MQSLSGKLLLGRNGKCACEHIPQATDRIDRFSYMDLCHMAYDTATVQMLREVLDEVLASGTFIRQRDRSAVEVAERVLWLASQGEREPATIKQHVLTEFLAPAVA